jgi:hypothetical protein
MTHIKIVSFFSHLLFSQFPISSLLQYLFVATYIFRLIATVVLQANLSYLLAPDLEMYLSFSLTSCTDSAILWKC